MGKNAKILFTDLDGTLLNDEKEVTAGNQAAIDRALEQGHKIVVTTGRPLASGLDIAERIGLTKEGCYVIAFNGGQIYDPFHKKTIYGKTFSKEVAKPLFQEAMDRGLHIQSYSDTQVLSLKENRELLFYISGSTVSYKIVPDLESAFPNDPYKILLVGLDNRAELDRYQEECVNPLKGTVRGFFSTENFLEIVPDGVSKGVAVKWLCEYLDIPLENSVAAGDAPNDVEMLQAAYVGAVMKNAYEGMDRYATYVTERDNNHDGVAEIIEKFILR